MFQSREKDELIIQDFDLHIPAVMQKPIKKPTFRRKTMTLPLCAEKIDAVKKCGIEISAS